MSEVMSDHWDQAYEEGREAGRVEAWSGEWSYRRLMDETRERAIKDCIAEMKKLACHCVLMEEGGRWHCDRCRNIESISLLLDTQ